MPPQGVPLSPSSESILLQTAMNSARPRSKPSLPCDIEQRKFTHIFTWAYLGKHFLYYPLFPNSPSLCKEPAGEGFPGQQLQLDLASEEGAAARLGNGQLLSFVVSWPLRSHALPMLLLCCFEIRWFSALQIFCQHSSSLL